MNKIQTFTKLLRLADELNGTWVPDWNKETMESSFEEGWKWRVIFIQPSYGKPQLIVTSCSSTVESPIHFKSKLIGEEAIRLGFDLWVDFLGIRNLCKELDV